MTKKKKKAGAARAKKGAASTARKSKGKTAARKKSARESTAAKPASRAKSESKAAKDSATTASDRKASGTARRASGTARKSSGTARKASGTKRKSSGTARKSSGTARKSSGTARKSSGTARKASGTKRKSASTAGKSPASTRKASGTTRKGAGKARAKSSTAREAAGGKRRTAKTTAEAARATAAAKPTAAKKTRAAGPKARTTGKSATSKKKSTLKTEGSPKQAKSEKQTGASTPADAATGASPPVKPAPAIPVPVVVVPGSIYEEMPTEELWSLYRKAASGAKSRSSKLEELRNALIERHYPLVRYIAERLLQTLPKSIELDDLVSAGLFGLMDAIRGFDADRGIKFKTYCSTRIRGSILDQLRSQDWVPRLVRLKAGRIEKALQRLTGEYGREPTHAELAKSLEMDHGDLVKEIQESRAKTMFSLSEKWEDGDDDGSAEKVEILEDRNAVDPVHELNRRDLMGYITRSLTQKEKFIIERYYRDGHTMREIGELLSLTESRVCQIHSNVMGRLKNLLSPKEESLVT